MYKVRLQSFEGPFDLLVYLIETAEMSIYDIKISQITNQYLEYLQAMQERNIAVATEFMVLAASLIEIKSKMILPRVSQEETALTEEDPRTELVERLLEYKRFKQAAQLFNRPGVDMPCPRPNFLPRGLSNQLFLPYYDTWCNHFV